MNYRDDIRAHISDSEVLTTAACSRLYFGGHLEHGCQFMQLAGYILEMLRKSRLCSRLHRYQEFIDRLSAEMGQLFKNLVCEREYILNSFLVPVCDNVRIARSRLQQGEQWRSWQVKVSMHRYFYGTKVQLMITSGGILVDYGMCLGAGRCKSAIPAVLGPPPEGHGYTNVAYTDYQIEDWLAETQQAHLDPYRKRNAKTIRSPVDDIYQTNHA